MSQESSLDQFMQSLHTLDPLVSVQQLQLFLRYRQELIEWNSRFNLTAITDPDEILYKHFLDSASLLAVYDKRQAKVLDIGAGAGFPGLPLKILRPRWRVVLLEATGKKVTFLRYMIEALELREIEAVQGRAEDLAHQQAYRASFDLVTARAVASLPILLEYAAPYCRVGGQIILPKKGDVTAELAQGKLAARLLGSILRADRAVTLPQLADGRRVLVWEQVKKCPESFPRSRSAMLKKPPGSV
jgi:16S rRNA (guanine527-N7)-methyltransferase